MANGSAVETSHSVSSLLKLRKNLRKSTVPLVNKNKLPSVLTGGWVRVCLHARSVEWNPIRIAHLLRGYVTLRLEAAAARKSTHVCVFLGSPGRRLEHRIWRYRFCNACIQRRIHCVCTFHWERTLHTLLVHSEREHMDMPGRHGPCSNIEHLLNQVWTRRPHKNY